MHDSEFLFKIDERHMRALLARLRGRRHYMPHLAMAIYAADAGEYLLSIMVML